MDNQLPTQIPPENAWTSSSAPTPAPMVVTENVVAGVVGSFLFALIGGVVYFLLYQIGFIAGITGLIIYVLANFGYRLFSGVKSSKKGAIVSIFMLVLVILLSEYICVGVDIYNVFKADYDITVFDGIRSAWSFIIDPEVDILGSVIFDVVVALALGGVAAFSSICAAIKASNAPEVAPTDMPIPPAENAPIVKDDDLQDEDEL